MAYEPLPFPNAEKSKKLVAEAEEFFLASQEAKRPREELYRKAYKLFRAFLKRTKGWKFSTLILDPVLWSALTTKSARMKKAIFSTFPVVRYKPEGDSLAADDERARGMTQMFGHYQQKDRPRVRLGAFLDALGLAGNGFVLWHWLYEEADVTTEEEQELFEDVPIEDELGVPQLHPETEEPLTESVSVGVGMVKVTKKEPIVDRPTWTSIHFTEAFPDASALGIHDGSYFIRRTFKRASHCKAMTKLTPEQGGWNKKAVTRALKTPCPVPIEEIRKNLMWATEIGQGQSATQTDVGDDPFVEVWEVYRQAKLTCYTVLNRSKEGVVAYKRVRNRLGRIPIDMVKCHPLDNEFWAMSTFELLEKTHQNYQDQRNAGAQETLLSMFGVTTVTPGFQNHKLLHEPGAVIPVTTHDQINFQQRPGTGIQMAQNQMSLERASMDEVTASSETYRGIQSRESRTATTDSLANQGAGLRLQDFIDDFEEQFVVPWGEWWLCDMQEHAAEKEVQRILKSPEDVAAFFDKERHLEVMSGAQSSEIRALEDKRMLESIEMQGKFKFPFIDEREMLTTYLERTIPEKVDAVVMDDEKMLQREVEKLELGMRLEVEKARIAIEQAHEIAKVQTAAQLAGLMAPPAQPGPPGMGGGPPPPGPPGMGGGGSGVDPSMSEPPMDGGMASEAAMMGQEQAL